MGYLLNNPGREEEIGTNTELRHLFEADQAARKSIRLNSDLPQEDAARRQRVKELITAGALVDPEDYYHAAMVFQHGESVDDYWQARELALKSAEMGYGRARWLAAAAYDRWLMQQGRAQKYGTQYRSNGQTWVLWDVDPETTDEERARWGVPPLEEAKRRAAELPPPLA